MGTSYILLYNSIDPVWGSIVTTIIGTIGTIVVLLIKLWIESKKREKRDEDLKEETKKERNKFLSKIDDLKKDTGILQDQITSNFNSLEELKEINKAQIDTKKLKKALNNTYENIKNVRTRVFNDVELKKTLDYIKAEVQFELETVLHDDFNAETDEFMEKLVRAFDRGFDNCLCDKIKTKNGDFLMLAKQEIKNNIFVFGSEYEELRELKNSTRRKEFIKKADEFFKTTLNKTLKYY